MKINLLKKILPFRKLFALVSLSCIAFSTQGQIANYSRTVLTGVALEPVGSVSGLITSAVDDGVSPLVSLPFSFTMNGISYSQFSVNSNGLLRLGSTIVSNVALNNLNSSTDLPKLTPYWDDLAVNGTGGIYYWTTGVSPNRKLIVEFKVTVPKNASNAIYQVWFFESNYNIQFVYGAIPTNSAQYSAGIATSTTDFISISPSGSTATTSTSVVNNANTAAITTGLSVLFTPPLLCPVSYTPATGSTGVNPTLGRTLTWANGGGATSYDVYFGTSPTPPLVSTSQTATSYATGAMSDSTTYYWKVISKNSTTSASACSTLSFTTSALLKYNVNRFTGIGFNSISTTGTSISSWKNNTSTDDNISNNVQVGFNFRYAGALYTSLQVGVNGFILFDTTSTATGGGTNPYNYDVDNFFANGSTMSPLMIAPFYQDLICQGNPGTLASLQSSIKYSLTGSVGSRVLTIEWINMETFNNSGPNLNFQIKLYEGTNAVEFVYGTMEGFNGTFNYFYKYNVGMTGKYISNPVRSGEIFGLLTENTRNFGTVTTSLIKTIPDCNSMLQFTPSTYSPYTTVVNIPVNDNVSGATHLDVNSSPCTTYCNTYYSSANATASNVGTACTGNPDDDVWFEFTATNPNTTIKVAASGGYTPALQLFNSSMVSLGCISGSAGFSATLNPTLSLNSQYFVRVYDANSGSGNSGRFSICVSATSLPPSNDDCLNAISMPVTASITYTTGIQNLSATASSGIPTCSLASTNPDDDVWYRFTASNTTEVISVLGSTGFDPVVQLFSGACSSLSAIQCVNSTGSGQLETLTATNLTRNQVYYFRIYHYGVGAGTGNYSLNVSSPLASCPATLEPATGTINVPVTGLTLRWSKVSNVNQYRVLIDSLNNPPTALYAVTTDTFYVVNQVTPGFDYFWSIQPENSSGYRTTCQSNYFSAIPLLYSLNIKTYLQGFYIGNGQMNKSLNPADTLADTITVNLVDPVTKNISYTTKALLSIYGNAYAYFPQAAIGRTYYIVLKHRNSLETWSASTFGFNSQDTLYNFSDAANKAFGNNMVLVSTGVYALHGGDINQDGFINIADFQLLNSNIGLFYSGYIKEDVNGDKIVESSDYSFMENKLSTSVSVLKP